MKLRFSIILLALWVSVVSLMAETVNLNFFVDGEKILTKPVTAGSTYTLSTIISAASIDMTTYECRDYTFRGWKVGSPVEGDETPTMPATVTPVANVNLYAVFRKATTNRYVRITTLDNLEANANYLIVCYYVYGGEQQYYALGSREGQYTYNATTYYNVSATRLFPRQGVITEPDEDLVWTLKGSTGAWKWTNDAGNKGLKINDNRTSKNHMLVSKGDASSCNITVANGIFTIAHNSNGWALRYVDDAITETEDYFITGSSSGTNNYPFYLYKKESPYTSYPDCDRWVVYLDAVDGTIKGKTPTSAFDTLTEASAGAKVTLPEAEMTSGSCSDWTFAGWHVDSPVEGTSSAPTLHTAGTYDPLYNGVTLNAVFKTTETVTTYEKISSSSEIVSGGKYIITNYGENKAISNAWKSGSKWDLVGISPVAGVLTEASNSIVWTFNGTYFVSDEDSGPLAWNQNTSYYFYVKNRTSPVSAPFYLEEYGATSYHLWCPSNADNTEEDTDDYTKYTNYRFYIYKKVTRTVTTYTSYPHCEIYSTTLHACGGKVEGEDNVVKRETSAGAGFTLPTATPACSGWEFVGWFTDGELPSTYDIEFTDCKKAGSTFRPAYDHMDLYAVYSKPDDKFRIIEGISELVSGDTYLVTYFSGDGSGDGKSYDFELSSVSSGSYLKGVKGVSPQNGAGYYMQTSDSAVMWKISGSGNSWTMQNLKTNKYLKLASDGISTTNGSNTVYIQPCNGDQEVNIGYDASSGIYYDNTDGLFKTEARYWSGGANQMYGPWNYVYRREKEFTSWPHCERFVVHFDACGGTADDGELTEPESYAGVVLPDAYANSDCSKEGWTFVGWAESPVMEETDMQTFNLMPPTTVYHPASETDTLYAVYHVKTNKYKRISSAARLYTGTNYIIAYVGASNKYALSNLPDNAGSPSYVQKVEVFPNASQIITNENSAIDWQLRGTAGEYELYNVARDVYLDLSEPGLALLSKSTAVDQFDITYSDSKAYSLRSVQNLANGDDAQKYLGYSSSYFRGVSYDNRPTVYFYRQQSTYCSYPSCIDEMDAIAWAKVDGTFNSMTLESYNLKGAPDVHNSSGSPERQTDGTWLVKFNNSVLAPFAETTIQWDGTKAAIKIPYIVSDDADLTSFLDPADDRSQNDVYIMPGNTLTIDATDTLHTLTVPDGATLDVANTKTLTVNSLVLFSEGDQSAPMVNVNASGAIVLKNGELYHDRRIDENRYYWLTLPYESKLKEISYSNVAANGKIPTYRTDYWLKYYDGASRAADANGGMQESSYWAHVAPKNADYTIKAGQGYILGIADQATTYFSGQVYTHTKRILRFTMRPDKTTWLTQEHTGGSKVATVTPSTVEDPRNAVHAGWNLIGNPYMHTYNTGSVTGSSGLRNGAWAKELDEKDDWTGWWIVDGETTTVPYLTLYNPAPAMGEPHYTQVLASNRDLRPFEAVFIQVNDNSTINFMPTLNISAMPAYMRLQEEDAPVRTGITLTGADRTDATGFVISEEYSADYEIGADLAKMTNKGTLNLYTINADEQLLAFNGLSEEDAATPIPVGVQFHADGEYTFAFDAEHYNGNAISEMLLIDYVENTTTNLLYSNYTFVANRGTNNQRFAIVIRLAQAPQVTTDIDNFNSSDAPRKVIRDGHLFILREDDMYDAVGTRIR